MSFEEKIEFLPPTPEEPESLEKFLLFSQKLEQSIEGNLTEERTNELYIECLSHLNYLLVSIGSARQLEAHGILVEQPTHLFKKIDALRRALEQRHPSLKRSRHLERRRFMARCKLDPVLTGPPPRLRPKPSY